MSLLILDLGGVLFDIEFEQTRLALMALPGYNGTPLTFGVEQQSDVFVAYDRGDITTSEFRSSLRSMYGFTCSDQDLDRAWCAILDRGLFHDALDRIERFKIQYNASRTVILSNISELHHLDSAQRCAPVFASVDNVYLSYMIHLRKPDPKAFIHVCTEEGFAPADTILVDDSILNCLAATELGIQTLRWVEH
jgi:putative hydrolase of the HAD superfamily